MNEEYEVLNYQKGMFDIASNKIFEKYLKQIEHKTLTVSLACDICKTTAFIGYEKEMCNSELCIIKQAIVALAKAGYRCYYSPIDDMGLIAILTKNKKRKWCFYYFFEDEKYILEKSSFNYFSDPYEKFSCIPVSELCKDMLWIPSDYKLKANAYSKLL